MFSKLKSRIIESLNKTSPNGEYPYPIERRFKGYRTAAIIFLIFGLLSGIFMKSIMSMGLGLLLAGMLVIINIMDKKKLNEKGFANWRFSVIEHTRLTPLNKRPTGFYAEALDGPYQGKTCHIALTGQTVTPPEGQVVEICVPGDTVASPIRDILYIPQYYGLTLVETGVSQ